jgi:hypothetical protein
MSDRSAVAPSGVLSHRYLAWAVEVVGADRLCSRPTTSSSLLPEDFLAAAALSAHERNMIAGEAARRARAVKVNPSVMPRGGHFAALEQPALLADDIREFFAHLAV